MDAIDGTVVLRVLIAEDEEYQRESLEALFKSANSSLFGSVYFDAHLVSSAEECLETLRRDADWQLVMLDIFMPGRRGDEIIGDVRATLGDKVPLLMISANAQMGAVQRCLRLGADLFVAKPVHLNVVRNLWQHCMLKHPTLFDALDTLPATATVPSSPHLSMSAPSDATSSVPTAAGDAPPRERAAELVAQLEKLNMPPGPETPAAPKEEDAEEEDAEEGACKQQ